MAPMIEVCDVAKSFGDVQALRDVDLSVEQGSVLGLLGPNGAGKTTLVNVLATLHKPDRGTAKVAGLDVVADAVAVRSVIGLAGQFAAVDEVLSGRENLVMVGRLYRLGRREAVRRADEVLERLGLSDAATRPVRTYSGGMRRRLDLGASLVGRPSVLILDEPTTGLDPRTRQDLWGFIEELVTEGTTVLLTTQYLEEADHLADSIVVIDQGTVIAEGTSEQLKDRLGGDVFEIRVADRDRLDVANALLGALHGDRPTVDAAERRVSVPARDGAATLVAGVRGLDEAGIVLDDVALRRPSLDDVFLTLTGKGVAA
jgi:daunorubicin resistance ABC transporter ATP-binding subunit